jgi:hypothetical protein
MWVWLRPTRLEPPWLVPEWKLRRERRIAVANTAWGASGLLLLALALLGVW